MPRTTIRSEDVTDLQVKTDDIAADAVTAPKIATGAVPAFDDSGLQADIALLAFQTQANGSLARYNLVDQSVDSFQTTGGVDLGTSTNENYESTGKYFSGKVAGTQVFNSTGTWDAPTGITSVGILLVAGGGGGGTGTDRCGGGGAGGLVYIASGHAVTAGNTYTATIGDGGGAGLVGLDSTWAGTGTTTITTKGGGAGATGAGSTGGTGGSGGGGSYNTGPGGATNQGSQPGVSGSAGFGFAGGVGAPGTGNPDGGGGGGGAGAVGGNAPSDGAGNGGAGKDLSATSWIGTTYGVSGFFAGGGGGSVYANTEDRGTGGTGGGGAGGDQGNAGDPGTVNTGSGGGGSGTASLAAGTGGKGLAIINWSKAGTDNMTLVSNTITATTAPTKGDLVLTYTNGAGTAVLGTNLTAEYSADNGSTWTDFGIGASDSQGTTGGHTVVTKNNVSLTSTSGTNMRFRIKTLVQSASIETRIHAVSLGWS
jgi:hypothetical protein